MSEREAEAYYEAQRERDEHERQCAEADLAAKLEGKRLFRVEVTRTYVGYVIADGEVEAASLATRIYKGYEADPMPDTDVRVYPDVHPTGGDALCQGTYHSIDGSHITVREYLAAKGGER